MGLDREGIRQKDFPGMRHGGPWEAVYEAHYQRLFRLCCLLTGRREVAEDLAQDVFVRSASHWREAGAESEALQWAYLRKSAVNLWKNMLRRAVLEARHRETGDHPKATDLDVRDSDLWSEIIKLPTRQRACLVLRFYEDLSERDAASVLGISVGAVKSHTSRGKARIRKAVGDDIR